MSQAKLTLRHAVQIHCLILFLLLSAPLLSAQQGNPVPVRPTQQLTVGPKTVPGEILVRFSANTPAVQKQLIHRNLGTTVLSDFKHVEGLSRVRVSAGMTVDQAIRSYRQNPTVLYAEPNYVVHAVGSVNDPQFPSQWNLLNTGQLAGTPGADIHATQAWNITTGSSNVVVGVIDTGVDYTHEDLAANIWSAPQGFSVSASGTTVNCPSGSHGFDMITNTCDPLDDNGHGTHVSGIIGAAGNNGIGVTGINWRTQIISCKFLDSSGNGSTADAIACLDLMQSLHDSGIPIVATNNSWGGASSSTALADAIASQASDGILFVAASGNDFADNDVAVTEPADVFSPNLISVAATTRNDSLAAFSNTGLHSVHVGAPGQEIVSTYPDNSYATLSGTSMAAPHVTGLAALLKSQDSTRDWRAIRNLILAGGDLLPSLAGTITGRRLDAYGSLTCSNVTVQRRLQPTLDVIPATVGQPIILAALNISCDQPAGPVQVTVQPTGQVITLSDDGLSPDQASGDGIYTGQFIPQGVNNYTLTFPWGDAVEVEILNNYTVGETPYNYRNISGTNLNLGDDSIAAVNALFPVHFGGATFNTLYVSSNGILSFTNAFGDFINQHLPIDYEELQNAQNAPPPSLDQPVVTLLAPWWQDLTPIQNSANNVFWDIVGSAPNRELVVEWRNVPTFDCSTDLDNTITFQVVLSESSDDVIFNYSNAQFGGACASDDFGASAEIGVQVSQTSGAEWSYETPSISSGTALLWSIAAVNPPVNPVPIVNSISPTTIPAGSADTVVTVTGANFVPGSQVLGSPTTYVSSTSLQLILAADNLQYAGTIRIIVTNPAPGGGFSNPLVLTVQAQPQSITSISPSSAPAGSFGFSLTVQGTGFTPATIILWGNNGGYLQTTYVSSTELTGIVPGRLLSNPGTVPVGVLGSNQLPFTITFVSSPAEFFAPPQDPSPPAGLPGGGTTAKPVIAPSKFFGWKEAATHGADYLKTFLRPRADIAADVTPLPVNGVHSDGGSAAVQGPAPLSLPGFAFRPKLPGDFLPASVVAGDFNGDGIPDFAVANAGSNNIWIYLGKGDGSTQIPYIVALRGYAPVAIAAADMNGDGKLDLIVAEADSGDVGVLLGNGDGTFQPERFTYVPAAPLSLAVADFNGDGHLDVVAGLSSNLDIGPLAFLSGDGAGNLGLPVTHFGQVRSAAFETVALATADLNGDGLPDIVAVQFSVSIDGINLEDQEYVGAAVYLNAGNGNFKLFQVFDSDNGASPFGHAVTAVALADINRDGCIDAVTVDVSSVGNYFSGNCDGTFDTSSVRTFAAGSPGGAVALADLNGDGNLDLITAGSSFNGNGVYSPAEVGDTVSVQFGDGSGSFSAPTIYRGEPGMYSVAVADLNGDGKPDIVTANQNSDSVSVYLNNGTGGLAGPDGEYIGYLTGGMDHATANAPESNFAFLDVNGDGHKDLILFENPPLSFEPQELSVLLGDGQGHYGLPIRSAVIDGSDGIKDVSVGDVRNSGLPDVLLLENHLDELNSWYLVDLQNNGDGTFQRASYNNSPLNIAHPYRMVTGDFNGDGKLDALVLSQSGPVSAVISPYLGQGDGTFNPGTPVVFNGSQAATNPPAITNVIAGDFNSDGKLDLLVWGQGLLSPTEINALYFLPGNGDGTFGQLRLLFNNFGYFATADLNGDGIPDLVEIVPIPVSEPFGQLPPLEYEIYLGRGDGSFQPAGTYGPYPGQFSTTYLSASLTDPMIALMPLLSDFNGDGKIDIGAYQTQNVGGTFGSVALQNGPGNAQLSILLGNGDGTFTPSYVGFGLERQGVPQVVVDTNGDNRADLVQLDSLSSTYHVIPATTGPTFQIGLVSDPVVGTTGTARIILALPSSSATTIQLTASDANVSLPSSVTIQSGSVTTDVPFQIASNFDPTHVFAIYAEAGSESHTAYGTKALSSQGLGFSGFFNDASNYVVLPSQTTADYGPWIVSIGGYTTQVGLSCSGLPAGAACQFESNPVPLGPGSVVVSNLTVTTLATLPVGVYPFNYVMSDGVFSQQIPATLTIGDFALSAAPYLQALSNSTQPQSESISISDINGFNGPITISCNVGLPPGASCMNDGELYVPSGVDLLMQNVTPGTYAWTVSGINGGVTRSVTVHLLVTAQQPQIHGSVTPQIATIAVGTSANFTVTLQGQDGASGPFTLMCNPQTSAVSCVFNPSSLNLSQNGSASAVLTVAASAQATSYSSPRHRSERTLWIGSFLVVGLLFLGAGLHLGRLCGSRLSVPSGNLRPIRVALMISSIALLALTLQSCAGSGASTSGSPPPTSTTPPPFFESLNINIQASGPGVVGVVGTVTVQLTK